MSIFIENLIRQSPTDERHLLDGISLSISTGEFVALVGPSGAGKTTLLRAIAGLDHYKSGLIALNGTKLENLEDRAGKIGFVFQNYALFPHMTVARNISFGLDILPHTERAPKKIRAERVKELLALMQLSGMEHSYPARLSGGQRQRVALARALATSPGLLLLDEPFGALDPIVRRTIRTWLRALHDQLGLTTILVTHDQEEALEVADRIVVMQQGRIVQDASPLVLDAQPNTAFVMQFLGETVAFEGVIRAGVFYPDEKGVSSFKVSSSSSDGVATVMVRPFEITLTTTDQHSALNLKLYSQRNGFSYYTAQLKERNVPVFVYNVTGKPEAHIYCSSLSIERGKIFRDGVRIGP